MQLPALIWQTSRCVFVALAEKDAALKSKKLAETRRYLDEALAVSTEIDAKDDLMDTYQLLASLDSAQGNWKDAYFYHTKFVSWRDSVDNEENVKKMVQSKMNFEFNKKEAITKAEQEKKDASAAEEARKQTIITWFIGIVLLFAVLFALFILRNNRQSRAEAQIIAEKNVELERLSIAASEAHNVVIILSPDGKVEWANESFTRLNGISIEELKRIKGETIFDQQQPQHSPGGGRGGEEKEIGGL